MSVSDLFCDASHGAQLPKYSQKEQTRILQFSVVPKREMYRRNPTRIEMTIKDIEEFDEFKKKLESAKKDSKEQTSRDSVRPGTSVRDICEAVGLRKRGAV